MCSENEANPHVKWWWSCRETGKAQSWEALGERWRCTLCRENRCNQYKSKLASCPCKRAWYGRTAGHKRREGQKHSQARRRARRGESHRDTGWASPKLLKHLHSWLLLTHGVYTASSYINNKLESMNCTKRRKSDVGRSWGWRGRVWKEMTGRAHIIKTHSMKS